VLHYYVDILGFTLLRDAQTPSGRWIELAPGDESVIVTLEPAAPGVSVDDILRWPGVPRCSRSATWTATRSR
jgi:hypothetical protein